MSPLVYCIQNVYFAPLYWLYVLLLPYKSIKYKILGVIINEANSVLIKLDVVNPQSNLHKLIMYYLLKVFVVK